MQIIFIKR